VHGTQTTRNSSNEADEKRLPNVPPPDVCQMLPREFDEIVQQQNMRLLTVKNERWVFNLEKEFVEFKNHVPTDDSASDLIKHMDVEKQQCWKQFAGKFERVQEFLSGLATVFLGPATVEANFSELKWTKDEYSM
jgi:hypothetical protein